MTCVELYQKVLEGMQSHCLEVNEGTGCGGCPYYSKGAYEYIVEENDRPCYKDLLSDEDNLIRVLRYVDILRENK